MHRELDPTNRQIPTPRFAFKAGTIPIDFHARLPRRHIRCLSGDSYVELDGRGDDPTVVRNTGARREFVNTNI